MTTAIPLKQNVWDLLSELRVSLSGDTSLPMDIFEHCATLRNHLLRLEHGRTVVPISGGSFWDFSPKCQFDVLATEMPKVADQLAFAIGFSSVYLPLTAPVEMSHLERTTADSFFWYHVDFGFRLASSGWDRIALLLNLAFDLGLGHRCTLKKALTAIPKHRPEASEQRDFENLKTFCDTRFKDLEAGPGRGARHETTHVMAPHTRYWWEVLETCRSPSVVPVELRPTERRDMLVEHHKCFMSGVYDTIRLISSCWPQHPPTGTTQTLTALGSTQ